MINYNKEAVTSLRLYTRKKNKNENFYVQETTNYLLILYKLFRIYVNY